MIDITAIGQVAHPCLDHPSTIFFKVKARVEVQELITFTSGFLESNTRLGGHPLVTQAHFNFLNFARKIPMILQFVLQASWGQ